MLAEAAGLGAKRVTVFETPKNVPARNWLAGYGVDRPGENVNFEAFDHQPTWPGHLRRD